MKQRRFGKKVQNWHRPLAKDAIGARHRRAKSKGVDDAAVELVAAEDAAELHFVDLWRTNQYWCCEECRIAEEGPIGEEGQLHALSHGLSALLRPTALAKRLALRFASPSVAQPPSTPSPARGHSGGRSVEQRLLAHFRELRAGLGAADALAAQLLGHVPSGLDLVAVEREAKRLRAPGLTRNLCLFAPFWLRSPSSWQQPAADTAEHGVSLVEHLLGSFPVPECLLREWYEESASLDNLKWLQWTILIGQGGSLRRAARLFGWQVSGRFQHHFVRSPATLDCQAATLRAEVMGLGGEEQVARRMLAHPGLRCDATEPSTDPHFERFRRELVRWLVRHGEAFDDAECHALLDWALHDYWECRRVDGAPDWLGRGVRAVRALVRAYAEQQFAWTHRRHDLKWAAHDLDLLLEGDDATWDFVELTSGAQLAEESAALRHCVAGYDLLCAQGYSAIVSVRCDRRRVLTIELRPHQFHVVQVCGLANRRPTADERLVVARWLRAVRERRDSRSVGGGQ